MIAHPPETVLTAGESLVGGEDDERVLVELVLRERLQDAADAVVDAADLGRVAPHRHRVVDVFAIVEQPRVGLVPRERRQQFVGVVIAVTIAGFVQQQLAETVRAVVGEEQEERLLRILADVRFDELARRGRSRGR